jgi:hypothetical protein
MSYSDVFLLLGVGLMLSLIGASALRKGSGSAVGRVLRLYGCHAFHHKCV